jgi:hypothetical protein
MSPRTPSENSAQDEPIGLPMNDATNDTRPYPDHDPMRELLGDPTEPLSTTPGPADSVDTEVIAPARVDTDPTPGAAHTQDATTTESFPWTAAPGPDGSARPAEVNRSAHDSAPSPDERPPHTNAPAPASGSTHATAARIPTPPRAGTIVWGCILFLIAAFAAVPAVLGEASLSPTAILWTVVGFGALLVVGGLVGAIVGFGTRQSRAEHPRND